MNSIVDAKTLEKKLICEFLRTLNKEDFQNLSREFNYFNQASLNSDEYFHPLGCFDMDVPGNIDYHGQDKLCVIYGWREQDNQTPQALLIWNHEGATYCNIIDISGAFRDYPINNIF